MTGMKISLILILIFLNVACAKTPQDPASSMAAAIDYNGYYSIEQGISGKPVFVVWSFISNTEVQLKKFYLQQDLSVGTYSIDKATLSKAGFAWTLVFHDSDCATNGSSLAIDVSYYGDDALKYALHSSPTTTFNFWSFYASWPKLDQYHIENYPRSSNHCD